MTIQTKKPRLNADTNELLKVERPFYEQHQFNNELNYCNSDDSQLANCSQWMRNFKVTNVFRSMFPIYTWLSQYSVKNDLFPDVISGCTVAIMHIPQGKPSRQPAGQPMNNKKKCVHREITACFQSFRE